VPLSSFVVWSCVFSSCVCCGAWSFVVLSPPRYFEFVKLATQAFEDVAHTPTHALHGTHIGRCSAHGITTVFRVDGFCVQCEREAVEHQTELLPPGMTASSELALANRSMIKSRSVVAGGASTIPALAPPQSWLLAHAAQDTPRTTPRVVANAASAAQQASRLARSKRRVNPKLAKRTLWWW